METSYLSVSHFDCQISKSYWCKFKRIIVTICTSLLFLVWCNSRKLCDITDSCSWVKELLCCNQRALHKLFIPLIFCEALFICLKRIFGFHHDSANASDSSANLQPYSFNIKGIFSKTSPLILFMTKLSTH